MMHSSAEVLCEPPGPAGTDEMSTEPVDQVEVPQRKSSDASQALPRLAIKVDQPHKMVSTLESYVIYRVHTIVRLHGGPFEVVHNL